MSAPPKGPGTWRRLFQSRPDPVGNYNLKRVPFGGSLEGLNNTACHPVTRGDPAQWKSYNQIQRYWAASFIILIVGLATLGALGYTLYRESSAVIKVHFPVTGQEPLINTVPVPVAFDSDYPDQFYGPENSTASIDGYTLLLLTDAELAYLRGNMTRIQIYGALVMGFDVVDLHICTQAELDDFPTTPTKMLSRPILSVGVDDPAWSFRNPVMVRVPAGVYHPYLMLSVKIENSSDLTGWFGGDDFDLLAFGSDLLALGSDELTVPRAERGILDVKIGLFVQYNKTAIESEDTFHKAKVDVTYAQGSWIAGIFTGLLDTSL